jgi:hypothetical protein
VGGSTEVNSGLWNRLPEAIRAKWAASRALRDFGAADLDATAARVEGWLGVSTVPGALPPSSQVLEDGARALG